MDSNITDEETKFKIVVNDVLSGFERRTCVKMNGIPTAMSEDELLALINVKFLGKYSYFRYGSNPDTGRKKKTIIRPGFAVIDFFDPIDIAEFYNEFQHRILIPPAKEPRNSLLCKLVFHRQQSNKAFSQLGKARATSLTSITSEEISEPREYNLGNMRRNDVVFDPNIFDLGSNRKILVKMRGIPRNMTFDELRSLIDITHNKTYDFLYLVPSDNIRNNLDKNGGYAYINFLNSSHSVSFYKYFEGYRFDTTSTRSIRCSIWYPKNAIPMSPKDIILDPPESPLKVMIWNIPRNITEYKFKKFLNDKSFQSKYTECKMRSCIGDYKIEEFQLATITCVAESDCIDFYYEFHGKRIFMDSNGAYQEIPLLVFLCTKDYENISNNNSNSIRTNNKAGLSPSSANNSTKREATGKPEPVRNKANITSNIEDTFNKAVNVDVVRYEDRSHPSSRYDRSPPPNSLQQQQQGQVFSNAFRLGNTEAARCGEGRTSFNNTNDSNDGDDDDTDEVSYTHTVDFESLDSGGVDESRSNSRPKKKSEKMERASGVTRSATDDVTNIKPLRKKRVVAEVATGSCDGDGFGDRLDQDSVSSKENSTSSSSSSSLCGSGSGGSNDGNQSRLRKKAKVSVRERRYSEVRSERSLSVGSLSSKSPRNPTRDGEWQQEEEEEELGESVTFAIDTTPSPSLSTTHNINDAVPAAKIYLEVDDCVEMKEDPQVVVKDDGMMRGEGSDQLESKQNPPLGMGTGEISPDAKAGHNNTINSVDKSRSDKQHSSWLHCKSPSSVVAVSSGKGFDYKSDPFLQECIQTLEKGNRIIERSNQQLVLLRKINDNREVLKTVLDGLRGGRTPATTSDNQMLTLPTVNGVKETSLAVEEAVETGVSLEKALEEDIVLNISEGSLQEEGSINLMLSSQVKVNSFPAMTPSEPLDVPNHVPIPGATILPHDDPSSEVVPHSINQAEICPEITPENQLEMNSGAGCGSAEILCSNPEKETLSVCDEQLRNGKHLLRQAEKHLLKMKSITNVKDFLLKSITVKCEPYEATKKPEVKPSEHRDLLPGRNDQNPPGEPSTVITGSDTQRSPSFASVKVKTEPEKQCAYPSDHLNRSLVPPKQRPSSQNPLLESFCPQKVPTEGSDSSSITISGSGNISLVVQIQHFWLGEVSRTIEISPQATIRDLAAKLQSFFSPTNVVKIASDVQIISEDTAIIDISGAIWSFKAVVYESADTIPQANIEIKNEEKSKSIEISNGLGQSALPGLDTTPNHPNESTDASRKVENFEPVHFKREAAAACVALDYGISGLSVKKPRLNRASPSGRSSAPQM